MSKYFAALLILELIQVSSLISDDFVFIASGLEGVGNAFGTINRRAAPRFTSQEDNLRARTARGSRSRPLAAPDRNRPARTHPHESSTRTRTSTQISAA